MDLPTGRTVLVAVDFSQSARLALEGSLPLARKLGARLLRVHVWNPGGWVEEPELAQERSIWLERSREVARKRLEEEGHGLLASLLLGSTTDRVLELADRPVLVVPSPAA